MKESKYKTVRRYIEMRQLLIRCRQEHFKQLCHICRYYANCEIYAEYVDAWIELQKEFPEE